MRILPLWPADIFASARNLACLSSDTARTVLRDVEGTRLAPCVRAQTPKPKRKRIEGLQILGSSDCPKLRLIIQKEKITI